MPYSNLNPLVWWWRRKRLEAAVARAHALETEAAREAVLARLQGCPLLVAVSHSPEPTTNAEGRLSEDVLQRVLTSEGPEGDVLLVFTSLAELRKRNESAGALVLPIETIANSLTPELAGIVVNPGGCWTFVSREPLVASLSA